MDANSSPIGRLYYFNFGNDASLAHSHYTPKRIVQEMRRDLAFLPAWVAAPQQGNYIWLPSDSTTTLLFSPPFSLAPTLCSHQMLADTPLLLSLWGPEPSLAPLFKEMQHTAPLLSIPALYQKRLPRSLFDRSLASSLLSYCEVPEYLRSQRCSSVCEIEQWSQKIPFDTILVKLPFSSSGRGVLPFQLPLASSSRSQIETLLQRYKTLAIEPLLPKEDDWAAEFYIAADQSVRFEGLSHFVTEQFQYRYNIVESPYSLWQQLAEEVGEARLSATIEKQRAFLQHFVAPYYQGAVGIDMLTYSRDSVSVEDRDVASSSPSTLLLHPGVEINVRNTMGRLALLLYDRLGAARLRYHYEIKAFAQPNDACAFASQSMHATPPLFEDNKLVDGRLFLNPIGQNTRFVASLTAIAI